MRRVLFLAIAMAIPVMSGSSAHAADFCVAQPVGCVGVQFNETQLQAALGQAASNPGPDRVLIGAGTFAGPFTASDSGLLEVIGAGQGTTILTSSSANMAVFSLSGIAGSLVRDLTLHLTGGNSSSSGLVLGTGTTALRVTIRTEGETGRGALVGNLTLLDQVIVESSGSDRGVVGSNGSHTIRDSVLTTTGTDAYGISFSDPAGTLTIERTSVSGYTRQVDSDTGTVVISDSILDLRNVTGARGLSISNDNNGTDPLVLDADRVTIVGSGSNQRGILLKGDATSEVATGSVDDSLIHLTGATPISVSCVQSGGGTASLTVTASAYPAAMSTSSGTCPAIAAPAVDTTGLTLAFADATNGNYTPSFNSPLIDAGTTGAVASGVTDRFGRPRAVDGNGNGTARRDIGAFEYQRSAPSSLVASVLPAVAPIGTVMQFSGSASDADGEPLTFSWAFDDTMILSSGANVSHTFSASGQRVATLTVTDVAGLSASTTVMATVNELPTADPPQDEVADTIRPTLSIFMVPKAGMVRSTTAKGAYWRRIAPSSKVRSIRSTLSEPATLTLRMQRKVGTNFRPMTGTRTISNVPAGTLKLAFRGGWNGRLLPAGTYRVRVVAQDSAGNRSKPRIATFRLS
jgi:hypothetical protein